MSIQHKIALSAIAAALTLLAGCASAPKQAVPEAEQTAGANEPDLVAQLRERMAAGTLQRQEKAEDKKPSEAAGDTSRSPALVATNARQQAAMAVSADYTRAISLMAADQNDEALALLQKVSAKEPSFAGPVINQGVILLKQKKFAEAEKVLRQALVINARNPYAHNLLGIALRVLADHIARIGWIDVAGRAGAVDPLASDQVLEHGWTSKRVVSVDDLRVALIVPSAAPADRGASPCRAGRRAPRGASPGMDGAEPRRR